MKKTIQTATLSGPGGSKKGVGEKREGAPGDRLQLPAIGMESEFALVIDERPAKSEDVFGDFG